MGFRANSAARVLSGGSANVIGLTLRRQARTLSLEPFFMELISGLEAELFAHSYALLLQIVPDPVQEIAAYRRWWGEHRVDGILVCDVRIDDARISVLEQLGIPAVVLGPPGVSGSLASIWSDDAASLVETVRYLAALGHRRIARVGGIADLAHTRVRTDAFTGICQELGLDGTVTVPTDYSGEDGAQATRQLLSSPARPTALIYDNDIMAVAGLAVAAEMRLSVPADLSIVAWDDSTICQLVHPSLTALSRDIAAYGRQAARLLLAAVDGRRQVADVHVEAAYLRPRGSTSRLAGTR
jgi:DNA-binding LacI/PurR family transcriptional regulator